MIPGTLVGGSLGLVGWARVSVPFMVLLHPMNGQLDCDLGSLETRSKPYACHGPQAVRRWYFNLERLK